MCHWKPRVNTKSNLSSLVLVATWAKCPVRKWKFKADTKALVWTSYCSSRFFTHPQEFRIGWHWENPYADDLAIIPESLVEMHAKLILWKSSMEGKGPCVNMNKTNVLLFGQGLDRLQKPDKDHFDVCLSGVGTNSIFREGCFGDVQKKCNGISSEWSTFLLPTKVWPMLEVWRYVLLTGLI